MDIKEINSKNITKTEKQVMEVLLKHQAKADDVQNIAKLCGISHVQAAVAVQLLGYKKLIQPDVGP